MNGQSLASGFEGTRVRLQRVSDSRFFTGWLVHVNHNEVVIRVNGLQPTEVDDEFFVQVYGSGSTAMFRAVAISKSNIGFLFKLLTSTRFALSDEQVRVLVPDQKCSIKIGWFEAVGDVLDLSYGGMGLKLWAHVEKGEVVSISMVTSFGEIKGKGIVCYSRTMDGLTGAYRVGIEMYAMDSITEAKWNQMLNSLLDISKAA